MNLLIQVQDLLTAHAVLDVDIQCPCTKCKNKKNKSQRNSKKSLGQLITHLL